MKGNPLLALLRTAFPPTTIPAGAFARCGYYDDPEYLRVIEGKTWEEFDPNFLARRSYSLSFLGDEYLVAMLPVYLHLLIVFTPMSGIPDTLLSTLTRPEPGDRTPPSLEWQRKKFDGFTRLLTDAQKAAVATTLHEFIAMYPNAGEPAQRALDRYWGVFAEGRRNPLLETLRVAFPPTKIVVGAFRQNPYDDVIEY